MKYINPKYSLFDSCDFTWLADTDNGGGFVGGEGKISIPAEATKLFVSIELYARNSSSSSSWPIQIYFSDGSYNKVQPSTVQLYNEMSSKILYLETNNTKRLQAPFTAQEWHKVYLAIDTAAGTIDFYLDGDKVGSYTDYIKTGVKAINAKIKLTKAASSLYTKARNIIISDQYFPLNEEIIVVPASVSEGGWNNSDGYYSTDNEDDYLNVIPDTGVLDGYKVTACNVGMGTTVLGDNIKHLKLETGDYSATKEIPATGYGMYFDQLPTNIGKIKITSKA
jgi:hypothetical protein